MMQLVVEGHESDAAETPVPDWGAGLAPVLGSVFNVHVHTPPLKEPVAKKP
jgi:hypothetical protein